MASSAEICSVGISSPTNSAFARSSAVRRNRERAIAVLFAVFGSTRLTISAFLGVPGTAPPSLEAACSFPEVSLSSFPEASPLRAFAAKFASSSSTLSCEREQELGSEVESRTRTQSTALRDSSQGHQRPSGAISGAQMWQQRPSGHTCTGNHRRSSEIKGDHMEIAWK